MKTRSASSAARSSTIRSLRPGGVPLLPHGRPPAGARAARHDTALDHALVYSHWAWFVQPHLAAAWILWRHPRRFPRAGDDDLAVFDLGLIGYFAGADRPALVGGRAGPDPGYAEDHG